MDAYMSILNELKDSEKTLEEGQMKAMLNLTEKDEYKRGLVRIEKTYDALAYLKTLAKL